MHCFLIYHVVTCLFTLTFISNLIAQDAVVVFNELNYHPEGNDSTLEYVEIYNQLAINVDLSNWKLDGEVEFDFPEGSVIGGREYLMIAKDPVAVQNSTGISSALGQFSGTLSNSGGTLTLYKNNLAFSSGSGVPNPSNEGRRIMDQVEYLDVAPWPVAPDGSGFTLAKLDPATGTTQATNWSTSGTSSGTPGRVNSFGTPSSLSFNEVAGSLDPTFQIEFLNHGTSSLSLSGMILVSSDALHPDYPLPSSILSAGQFLVLTEAQLGYRPADNVRLFLMTASKTALLDSVRVDDRAQARFPDGTGPWLRPDAITSAGANSVTLQDDIVINEIFYHAPARRAVPIPVSNSLVQVLGFDDSWRYNLSAGTAGLSSGWAATSHSVDGVNWAEGSGLLGVESSTLGEPLETTLTLTTQVTYYFETEFQYDGTGTVAELNIQHYTDDGAIFYLNGVEIERFNLGHDAVAPTTLATGVGNASLQSFVVPSPSLLNGSNRLSVEVHQTSSGSTDIVCGAKVFLRFFDESSGVTGTPFTEREEEWLELYNRGLSAVNLTDWKLSGGIEYDFPANTTIPSGAYLVVAKDAAELSMQHLSANIIGDYDGKLADRDELIVLEDALGNPADEVHYYDARKWHGKADGGGSSLELCDPDSDNSVAGAWAPSDEVSRSSWQTYTYERIALDDGIGLRTFHELQLGLLDDGELLLDDVSVIEVDSNTEFLQNRDFESDAIGSTADKWRAIGNHGSHGKTVVVTDPDDTGNKCLHLVSTGPTENKHNKLETTFANSEEVVVGNIYRISFRAKYLSGSNQLNSRLYFNYLQHTTILDTPTSWGTPGSQNSVAVSNAGPTLDGLCHRPVIPNAQQAVTVLIDASDLDGLASVVLHYSVNGASFQSTAMTLTSDQRYAGMVPGQAASSLIRFYVEATDSTSVSSFFPAAAANSGAFYKVQDGLADSSGLRHNLRILMSDDDYDWLLVRTNRLSDDRLPATVIEDEETVYYDVAVRLKGSPAGRNQNSAYEYVIRFQPDHLFRGALGGIAVERRSLSPQLFSKHLNNRSGTPYASAYDDPSYIIPPDSGDRGLGVLFMARHSGDFFRSLHPDDSNEGTLINLELLYHPLTTDTGDPEGLKLLRPSSLTNGRLDLKDYGPDKETIRWGFEIRSARDRDDYSRIIALNNALALDGEAMANAFEQVADVDQWMRTFALMTLNGNDDVFSRAFEHNLRFYVRPDGKIVILQWDVDRAFQLTTTDASRILPSTNFFGETWSVVKLYTIPRFYRLFQGHVNDLINTTFNSSYLTPWATEFNSVSGVSVNDHLSYVTDRANLVSSLIPPAVPFLITTNSGFDFSEAASSAELEGNGWVDVTQIRVNGINTVVTWTDADRWQISVPIGFGDNTISLSALNHEGIEVGTDTITITNTSNIDLAHAGNLIINELHYHPADPISAEIAAGFIDGDDFEFIELVNTSVNIIDLSKVAFVDGIDFVFPANTLLVPGKRILVVSDLAAFEARYGLSIGTIAGEYSGNLRNNGEQVRLEAADLSEIADFHYGDERPWPEDADGTGYSLILTGSDPSLPENWRTSTQLDGNPGSTDHIPFTGGGLLAYRLASSPEFEIRNDILIAKAHLNIGADEASIFAQFSTDLGPWTTALATDLISRTNNRDGTSTVIFHSPVPTGTTQSQFVRWKIETP